LEINKGRIMDLEYGPEYQDFTKEVQSFCKKYKGLSFTDGSNNPLGSSGGSGGPKCLGLNGKKP
jgi:hypothetical protein